MFVVVLAWTSRSLLLCFVGAWGHLLVDGAVESVVVLAQAAKVVDVTSVYETWCHWGPKRLKRKEWLPTSKDMLAARPVGLAVTETCRLLGHKVHKALVGRE